MTDHRRTRTATCSAAIAAARRRGGARSRARRRARQERLGLGAAEDARRMTPDERKAQGPLINGLKDRVTAALAARRDALKDAALDARLNTETRRRHAAGARGAGRDRPHPSDQPGDRRAHRDLRRHGLRGRRRAGHRDRRLQLHQAQLPRRPSGARDARHVLLQPEAGRLAHAAAHAHLAGADPHHAERRSRRSASSCPGRTYRSD